MNELIIALGLFLIIEGIVYAIFPDGIKRMAEELPNIPTETLRTFGLGAVIAGLVVIWMTYSF